LQLNEGVDRECSAEQAGESMSEQNEKKSPMLDERVMSRLRNSIPSLQAVSRCKRDSEAGDFAFSHFHK